MIHPPIKFDLLWQHITEQFPLGEDSLHGPRHWRNVERFGLDVAQHSGADITVVRLFAVLHDSRRMNEGTDPDHGRRGAELAKQLRGNLFELDDERFSKLFSACAWHEKGHTSDDPTVGTCWDADRLDLPRVCVQPFAGLMSTAYGRELTTRKTDRR